MNKDKMELEEAINKLEKFIGLFYEFPNPKSVSIRDYEISAIETVLQELEKLKTDNQRLKDYLSEQGMISDYLKSRKRNV